MPPLPPREVYQRLRDAAMGVRTLHVIQALGHGHLLVDIEDWQLTLDFAEQTLHHCEHCRASDGRSGALDSWQRYGTDPVSLLSTWELAQLEHLLKASHY